MDIKFKRKKRITNKVHGFLKRMSSKAGVAVLKRRRARGRNKLTAQAKMLPKQYRLTKNRDIRRVMQKGRKLSVPDVRLQYLIGNKLNHPRITVLVSTKINKSAVKRNLLKRRIKSLLIEYINSNQTSVDVVITPFRELEYSKIAPAIKELLSKVS